MLEEIGAAEVPCLRVYNKVDQAPPDFVRELDGAEITKALRLRGHGRGPRGAARPRSGRVWRVRASAGELRLGREQSRLRAKLVRVARGARRDRGCGWRLDVGSGPAGAALAAAARRGRLASRQYSTESVSARWLGTTATRGNPWRSDKDKGPADLDAVVRDLQRKLAGLFRGGRGGGGGRGGDQPLNSGLVASAAVILRSSFWAASGFYASMRPSAASCCGSAPSRGSRNPGLQWHLAVADRDASRRSTSAPPSGLPYRGSMLTRDENIVNVDLVVQFRRTDPQKLHVQHARSRERR